MENQATKETFKHEHRTWIKHDGESIYLEDGETVVLRGWRSSPGGNGLRMKWNDQWVADTCRYDTFDASCKLALRALVGPPPWEGVAGATTEPAAVVPPTTATPTRELIRTIGSRLAALSNEAEQGFAELSAVAISLVEKNERLAEERDGWIADFRAVTSRATRLQSELDQANAVIQREKSAQLKVDEAIQASLAETGASHILGVRSPYDIILAAIRIDSAYWKLVKLAQDGHLPQETIAQFFLEIDGESEVASVIACPHREPLHFHHDGCPACVEDEQTDEALRQLAEDVKNFREYPVDMPEPCTIFLSQTAVDAIREGQYTEVSPSYEGDPPRFVGDSLAAQSDQLAALTRRLDGMDLAIKHHVAWAQGHLQGLAERVDQIAARLIEAGPVASEDHVRQIALQVFEGRECALKIIEQANASLAANLARSNEVRLSAEVQNAKLIKENQRLRDRIAVGIGLSEAGEYNG